MQLLATFSSVAGRLIMELAACRDVASIQFPPGQSSPALTGSGALELPLGLSGVLRLWILQLHNTRHRRHKRAVRLAPTMVQVSLKHFGNILLHWDQGQLWLRLDVGEWGAGSVGVLGDQEGLGTRWVKRLGLNHLVLSFLADTVRSL